MAIKDLQEGDIDGAIGKLMLMAFIGEVNGLISAGVLTPAEGELLNNAANAIIDQILGA